MFTFWISIITMISTVASLVLFVIGFRRGWKIEEDIIRQIEKMDPETLRDFSDRLRRDGTC